MKQQKAVHHLWENRPNYRIVYCSDYVDRADAEKFLNNLPIGFLLNTVDESGAVALLDVFVQGPSVEIFPSKGQEIRGLFLNKTGCSGRPVFRFRVRIESAAVEIEDVRTGQVFNEVSTLKVCPIDVCCPRWVGRYDFQREQSAHEEVEVFIYKRPRSEWGTLKQDSLFSPFA